MPNSIRPNGRFSGGSLMFTIVNAIGIMTPPVNPWAARKAIISTRLDANPAQHREGDEQDRVDDEVAPHPEDAAEVAGERAGDDLGHQVGGRDPGPLVEGRREPALDVLERGVGDLDVEHRHEGAQDGAVDRHPVAEGDGLRRLPGGRLAHGLPAAGAGPAIGPPAGDPPVLGGGSPAWGGRRSSGSPLVSSVSTVGTSERPGRSRPSSGSWSFSSRIFTGTRWTILVKLPVAFSGGRSANSAPDPGARLSRWPLIVTPG